MLATIARGTALLFLAAMIVAWALSPGKGASAQPTGDQPVERLYS